MAVAARSVRSGRAHGGRHGPGGACRRPGACHHRRRCPALLQHTFNRLQTGQPQSLCQFQGKVLLVVNTASYCGYTHQYEGLEAMYRKYKDRGLVIVGFPSNDFSQEPGTNKEVAEFCRTTYGVDFPQFEKSSVAHLSANPLYTELSKRPASGRSGTSTNSSSTAAASRWRRFPAQRLLTIRSSRR